VLKPGRGKTTGAARSAGPVDALAASIRFWVARQPQPAGLALDHHYTQRGLSVDLFKGKTGSSPTCSSKRRTRSIATCTWHRFRPPAAVRRRRQPRSLLSALLRAPAARRSEIGGTYEDELGGTDWTDVRGKKQPWGEIAFALSAIVASCRSTIGKPTSEVSKAIYGNAGNTLDRWYHRSAIVILAPTIVTSEVIAGAGAGRAYRCFARWLPKLATTPKKTAGRRSRRLHSLCPRIIAVWPRDRIGHWESHIRRNSAHDGLETNLLVLHDPTHCPVPAKLAEMTRCCS